MKYLLIPFCVLLFSVTSFSQFSKYKVSEPIDIPVVGWNRLLQMPNGNTMLFHMEPRVAMVVKVFDTSGKEIASQRHLTEEVKPREFERASFDGLFEMNGEAIMFLSADVSNKETLVRLHFDGKTGALLHEDRVIRSASFKNRTTSYVLHNDNIEGYAIVCTKDFKANPNEKIELYRYSKDHKLIKKMNLELAYNDYDEINFVGADIAKNGTVNISMSLTKYVDYPTTYNRYIFNCFNEKNAEDFKLVQSQMNSDLQPYYAAYSYNSFDGYHQVFLINSLEGYYENGLGIMPTTLYSTLMGIFAANDLKVSAYKYIENVEANKFYLENRENIQNRIELAASKFYPDDYGNTIIISQEHANNLPVKVDNRRFSLLGNISITKVMGNGKEAWGIMLPKKQMVPNYLSASNIYYRDRAINIFRKDDPLVEQVNEYASFYSFNSNRTLFIMFNDKKENFDRPESQQVDTLFDCTAADAVYYIVDSKKNRTKHWLYNNELDDRTTRAIYIDASNFNEERKVFAALMLHTIDDEKSEMRVSWHYQ